MGFGPPYGRVKVPLLAFLFMAVASLVRGAGQGLMLRSMHWSWNAW